jgi:hypothetical protein
MLPASRIALSALLLAACGGHNQRAKGNDGESAKPAPTEAAKPATPAAPTPAQPTPAQPAEVAPAAPPPAAPAPAPASVADAFPADCSVTEPSSAHHDLLWATAADHPPEILDGVNPEKFGQHYYVSDEGHADRFREAIANSGGIYVGIGSDQAYLYIGWARPQFAYTVDYDPDIVRAHQIQQAFLVAAASPAEYEALWQRDHKKQAEALVTALSTDPKEQKRFLKIYGATEMRMRKRMRRLHKNLGAVPSYLSDQPTYDFLRNLIRHGCVRPLLVDLLAKDGLRGIAEAATKVGLPVRTLYLSNAEEYWTYTEQFRTNVRGLPHDERSMALHTLSSGVNHDYRYVAQPLAKFVTWLDDPRTHSSRSMIGYVKVDGPDDFPAVRFEANPGDDRAKKKPK